MTDSSDVAAAVGRWLGREDLVVEAVAGGASNLTYRVQGAGADWVLRRPPAFVTATSNDMAREWTVLQALAPTEVPVPLVVRTCTDETVLGVPFYLMERLDGIVFRSVADVGHLDDEQARACTDQLVDVLASLHALDPTTVGLGEFGRPEGFLQRQVNRWVGQWEKTKFADLPEIDEAARRLAGTLPPEQPGTIVHGDYSFNNTIFGRDVPTVMQGVLDWELSTVGDPLTDIGLLILYWGDIAESIWTGRQAHRARPGFGTTAELLERYARASGRDLEHADFYVALATFKMAVIIAGARVRMADQDPERAARLEEKTRHLAGIVLEQTDPLVRATPR